MNCAQDFGTTVKVKELRVRSGLHSREVEVSSVKYFHAFVSTLNISLPSVKTVKEFLHWIPKIMVQFCYLRLHFGVDNVSSHLLQWIARIKNWLKLRPTKRYRTYSSNHDKYKTDSDQIMKVPKKVTLIQIMTGHAWPCRKDQN